MPSVVQGVTAQALSAAASITTSGVTTTSGNAFYVASGNFDSTSANANCGLATDSKSNSYANIAANTQIDTFVDGRWDRASGSTTGGASHTFTAHANASSGFPAVGAQEVSGYNTSTPEDGSAAITGVAGEGSPHTTPSVTTTISNDLILGVLVNSSGTTITGGTGTTLDSAVSSASGTPLGVGHKAATSPGAYTTAFNSDTADVVKMTVAVQPPASAAPAYIPASSTRGRRLPSVPRARVAQTSALMPLPATLIAASHRRPMPVLLRRRQPQPVPVAVVVAQSNPSFVPLPPRRRLAPVMARSRPSIVPAPQTVTPPPVPWVPARARPSSTWPAIQRPRVGRGTSPPWFQAVATGQGVYVLHEAVGLT